MFAGAACVLGALWAAGALRAAGAAPPNVTVQRLQLALETEHTLEIDHTREYILHFVPSAEQSAFPSRVWVRAAGALLLAARTRARAAVWQLRAAELRRTLCPDDGSEDEDGEALRRGEFTLHAWTWSAAPFELALRADVARDWALRRGRALRLAVSETSPSVNYYDFSEGEESVRLVLESEDEVCAIVAVQPYACPIAQTKEEIESTSVRMTMLRSGGAHLSRSRFPHGFYVIVMLEESEEACTGEPAPDGDWLWEQALRAPRAAPARLKRLRLSLEAALSRSQYWWACAASAAVFLCCYAAVAALVFAQRWPRWRRLVGPAAVLAKPEREAGLESATAEGARARRRGSTATFDSSDNSDTDSEEATAATSPSPPPAAPAAAPVSVIQAPAPEAGPARPFGLPAQLRVAALARRRARVLRARSDRYLTTLATVAVFYALPVVQFVAAFQMMLNVSGSLDLCYYNYLCAHPAGALSDFNHVYSNLGYMALGALFMLQVRRRRRRCARRPRDEEYGIPQHYGLLSALGGAMVVVALLSASYHVCPNRLNFQFDTAFMYVLAVLSMVKIYQARHPDINARAHATFAVLALLIALVVWGVLGGGPLFWSVLTVVHVFAFLLLSLQIYYLGQFRLEKESLAETARWVRAGGARPLYTARLVALLLANAINWGFAIYGLAAQPADIASHLLSVLLCNALLHMVFYLSMKLLHGERVRWYAWAFLGGAAAAWAPALYFFVSGSTDWSATPALSRHLNHECRLLSFYDAHDLWHALSALALYLTFNALLTWDDGLSAVRRTEIAVF